MLFQKFLCGTAQSNLASIIFPRLVVCWVVSRQQRALMSLSRRYKALIVALLSSNVLLLKLSLENNQFSITSPHASLPRNRPATVPDAAPINAATERRADEQPEGGEGDVVEPNLDQDQAKILGEKASTYSAAVVSEEEILRRRLGQQNKGAKSKPRPAREWVFHALHKTGSMATRRWLRFLCRRKRWRCLDYDFCGHIYQWTKCARALSRLGNGTLDESEGAEAWVDAGSFTPRRLSAGCCEKLSVVRPHALVEHFPLNARGAHDFLRHTLNASAPRFTILRHPVSQFLSYFFMRPMGRQVLQVVDELHAARNGSLPEALGRQAAILTNSQAKELGWSPGQPLRPTLAYLDSLRFVGLHGFLHLTWAELLFAMDWPPFVLPKVTFRKALEDLDRLQDLPANVSIDYVRSVPIADYKVPDSLRRKIEDIQYADMQLYLRAVQIFSSNVRARMRK